MENDSRRERKKRETRRRIVDEAMRLFRDQGVQSTTMEQIAERVDVSKATLYNYFAVKEAIIAAFMKERNQLCREQEMPLLIASFPDTRSRLMELLRNSLEWMRENRELYRAYFEYRMQTLIQTLHNPDLRSGFEDVLAMIVATGRQEGEIRDDMDVDLVARHLEMICTAALMPWWVDPEGYFLEKHLGPALDLFLNGAASTRR